MFKLILSFALLLNFSGGGLFFQGSGDIPVFSPFYGAIAFGQGRLNLAELKKIQALRTLKVLNKKGTSKRVFLAALGYLKAFPRGRYGDEALLALGEAQKSRKKYKQALKIFKGLIKKYPSSPFREGAQVALIEILRLQRKTRQANREVEKLLQKNPRALSRERLLLGMAQSFLRKKQKNSALRIFPRIGEGEQLSTEQRIAFFRDWVKTLLETGKQEKALELFPRLLSLYEAGAEKAKARLVYGKLLGQKGAWEAAHAQFQRIIQNNGTASKIYSPLVAEARYRKAKAFSHLTLGQNPSPEKIKKAIFQYDAYLEASEGQFVPQALEARADLHLRAGHKRAALRDMNRLAVISPVFQNDPQSIRKRAALMGELGEVDAALELLSPILTRKGLSLASAERLRVELAGLYYQKGDCRQVLERLTPSPLLPEGERDRSAFLQGFCLLKGEKWGAAAQALESLEKTNLFTPEVQKALGAAYEKSGQNHRRLALVENHLPAEKKERIKALTTLVQLYRAGGDAAGVLKTLERLKKRAPRLAGKPEMLIRRGEAQEILGQGAEAIQSYLRAIALTTPKKARGKRKKGKKTKTFMEALFRLQGVLIEKQAFEKLAKINNEARRALKGKKEATTLALFQSRVYLAWGRTGKPGKAEKRLKAAWAHAPPRGSPERIEVLKALGAFYGAAGAESKALGLFKSEQKKAPTKKYRRQVRSALGGFYLEWAKKAPSGAPEKKSRLLKALKNLSVQHWQLQYQALMLLDPILSRGAEFSLRIKLYGSFIKKVPDPILKTDLTRRLAGIYLEWGNVEAAKDKSTLALKLYKKGVKLVASKDWQRRYAFARARGEVLLARKKYGPLLKMYKGLLPEIGDKKLVKSLQAFMGQVYLSWARATPKKSLAQKRAKKALGLLPPRDWLNRLAALRIYGKKWERKKNYKRLAKLYVQEMENIPSSSVRQDYAMYLGRLYGERLKQFGLGQKWLKEAIIPPAKGGNAAKSEEAEFMLANLELKNHRKGAALKRLSRLAKTSSGTLKISIHYRLAVLYHGMKKLKIALKHYHIAATTRPVPRGQAAEAAQARKQEKQLKKYLKLTGKGRVSLPTVKKGK